ncbi:hypothetical protein HO173_004712 [Letharia columbiana]|uniref:Uncharacterized protein n=1 Tax=Letharia columbiana TaxID=112416 RepID=A0A8H6FYS0_9LECA|nr:uncharacterized protein HO173_004712 [Letharia columbiana]KAF6237244.1 hypothetical protein HO173_004712 [Letharia columbiana]
MKEWKFTPLSGKALDLTRDRNFEETKNSTPQEALNLIKEVKDPREWTITPETFDLIKDINISSSVVGFPEAEGYDYSKGIHPIICVETIRIPLNSGGVTLEAVAPSPNQPTKQPTKIQLASPLSSLLSRSYDAAMPVVSSPGYGTGMPYLGQKSKRWIRAHDT